MTVTLPQIDYTSKDYEAFREDMISLIATKCPEWTDTSATDFGIVLIELFAYVADILSYYQDRIANEAFLPTATLRKNVINLCKLIDYELAPAISATATLTFTASTVCTVPKGFQVSTEATDTEDSVIFETSSTLSILSAGTATVVGIQGYSIVDEVLGTSDGSENQVFQLDYTGLSYIASATSSTGYDSSLVLSVDEGTGYITWTEVSNFLDSDPTSKHFYTEIDENSYVSIYFGDNLKGKIPSTNATIKATYRVGGGVEGNVGVGTIIVLVDSLTGLTDVTNAVAAAGGASEESIEDARTSAPASLRALDRAVTLEDFETLSVKYPGVAQAKAERVGLTSTVKVYIAPEGGGLPSPGLKTDVKAYLDARKMFTFDTSIDDPEYLGINVGVTVTALSNYLNDTIYSNVLTSLSDAMVFGQYEFGEDVSLGNIYQVIENIPGVDYCDVYMLTSQPVAVEGTQSGNPTFGTITVRTGAIVEDWIVTMTSSTLFSVEGSTTGVTLTGALDTTYTNACIGFIITSGTMSPAPADYWTFHTDRYLGNVSAGTYTIATFNYSGALVTVTGGA